jgi:RND family efflux transporter MFP subunit
MTRWRTIAPVSLALAGLACGRSAPDPPAEPPAVRVAPVTRGSLSAWVRLSGRVVPPPDLDATLAPRVDGVLTEVTVKVGERVRRGQVLAKVGSGPLVDALTSADAARQSAAADAEAKRRAATRTRTLSDRGVVSGEQAETDEAQATAAEASLAQAEAARATASRRRSWADLAAPFDGLVLRVLRHAGEPVDGTPATPVVEIAAEHSIEIALDASASDLTRLKEGQAAEIVADSPGAQSIPAHVAGVAHSVDPATGTGPVRIAPSTDDAALLLGRIVDARIAVDRRDGVLFVPATALRGGEGGSVEAVVVTEHKAHIRPVVTGLHDGDRVEIVSGLVEGDAVVIDDPVGLAEDAPVRDAP